ncbi:MAG: plasmid stabilization protein [Verrucomicrobia bacterium]|nr:MAG: plasmid stabilization protein [Verrucomicrobiota bacterium]
MTLTVLHEADIEFSESVIHYEAKEPGLGERFRNEVAETVECIQRNPEVPRLRAKRYRRVNLSIFSHYIAYIIRADEIWSVAIAHSHRRPEFWLPRLRTL